MYTTKAIQKFNEVMLQLREFCYLGISLVDITPVSMYEEVRREIDVGEKKLDFVLRAAKSLVSILIGLFFSFCPQSLARRELAKLKKTDFLVTMDFDRPDFSAITRHVLEEKPAKEVVILTTQLNVYLKLRRERTKIIFIPRLLPLIKYDIEKIRLVSQVVKKIIQIDLNFREKIGLINIFYKTVNFIEINHLLLQRANVRGVFTLNLSLNERTLMKVAKKFNAKTFTTQHGLIAAPIFYDLDVDRFFAWGESSRLKLEEMGLDPQKIYVSGNPNFVSRVCTELENQKETRKFIADKYDLDNKKIIVGYFPINHDRENEMRQVFDVFATVFTKDMESFVKLKPDNVKKSRPLYVKWAEIKNIGSRLSVVFEEPSWKYLAASDIVITVASSAGVEALAFGKVSIIIDIFEEYDLPNFLPHYQDCLVVKSEAELEILLANIQKNKDYLNSLMEKSNSKRSKHFQFNEGKAPAVEIAQKIREDLGT